MFALDLRSRIPIYEQLVDKIRELIINDILKPEEQLPAVRVLASELTVNPNTIQKAYRELEHLGYIYSIPGKGSFVKPTFPGNNSLRLQTLQKELTKIIAEMLYLGMTAEEVRIVIDSLLSKEGGKLND